MCRLRALVGENKILIFSRRKKAISEIAKKKVKLAKITRQGTTVVPYMNVKINTANSKYAEIEIQVLGTKRKTSLRAIRYRVPGYQVGTKWVPSTVPGTGTVSIILVLGTVPVPHRYG